MMWRQAFHWELQKLKNVNVLIEEKLITEPQFKPVGGVL